MILEKLIKKFRANKKIFSFIFLAFFLVIYFSYNTIFGSKGVISFFTLKKELEQKNLAKNNLKDKLTNQQNLVDKMSLKSLDLDLLDEEARKNLGYANKNEIILYEQNNK